MDPWPVLSLPKGASGMSSIVWSTTHDPLLPKVPPILRFYGNSESTLDSLMNIIYFRKTLLPPSALPFTYDLILDPLRSGISVDLFV
ncbi:hypothetical protein E2C01_066717 [Portunus trituberculatus]|uniref:Uncharacterized protein n=1 Tax=Portunus trituberculatus TaxID=210409 RepID=A0A5B7HQJ6_PORTR|nr:hypothetical protein [Portunus trituberculatus]